MPQGGQEGPDGVAAETQLSAGGDARAVNDGPEPSAGTTGGATAGGVGAGRAGPDGGGPGGGGTGAAAGDQGQPEGAAGSIIHLGTGPRSGAHRGDTGELAAYSSTASGLSALGRAQARAQRSAGPSGGAVPVFGRTRRRRRGGRRAARPVRSRSRRGLHRSRQRPRFLRAVLLVVLAVFVVAVAAAVFVGVQLRRSVPPPELHAAVPVAATVNGPVPRVPWPASTESAIAVAGIGPVGSAGPSSSVPIASLAKVMAAVVLLRDHPLAVGQPGPSVTISPADQAAYQADQAAGDSVAPVAAGESLDELQLLDGLLIPSADNLAPVVARWDAGSQAAFVAKMNAVAAALGMRTTRYTDPSGIPPTTVSTASDQLRLAETVAANPLLMSIVRQPQLTLPNSPELSNYNSLLGQDGIVGIKTGATSAAGGCFMFAADAPADGRQVEVLGVVLGERGTPLISAALHAGELLIRPVAAGLHAVTALPAGTVVAHITDPWSPPIPVITTRAVTVLHLGPTPVDVAVRATRSPVPDTLPAGSQVATVTVSAGGQVQTVTAVTDRALIAPSRRWRLERI